MHTIDSSNRTLANKTKYDKLNIQQIVPKHHIASNVVLSYLFTLNDIDATVEEILFSMGCNLLRGREKEKYIEDFLASISLRRVDVGDVPREFDILGSAYQYLTTKADNLRRGSFYTGKNIANDLVEDLDFSKNQNILDPSCGSGVLLFLSNCSAENIFGVDNDSIAVMIAKFNYFIKFSNAPRPKIFCDNFFNWCDNSHLKFDYIIGNPPYGGEIKKQNNLPNIIRSGETFSYFTVMAHKILKDTGKLRFLLPISSLNVPRHTDLRQYLFDNVKLVKIKKYNEKFNGVITDIVMLELQNGSWQKVFFEGFYNEEIYVDRQLLNKVHNKLLLPWTSEDVTICEKVENRSSHTLIDSTFGLGIVTGNNKDKLVSNYNNNFEPIYTRQRSSKIQINIR